MEYWIWYELPFDIYSNPEWIGTGCDLLFSVPKYTNKTKYAAEQLVRPHLEPNQIKHFHTPPCRNIKRVASRSSIPDQEASQGFGQVQGEGGGGIYQALLPETGGLLVRGNAAMFINGIQTFPPPDVDGVE